MTEVRSDDETVVLSREAIERMHGHALSPDLEEQYDEAQAELAETCRLPALADEGWLS